MHVRTAAKVEIAVHSAPDLAEDNYAPRWIETLESLGANVRICDFRAPDIIDQVRGVDGAMWHFYHLPRERQSAPMILFHEIGKVVKCTAQELKLFVRNKI